MNANPLRRIHAALRRVLRTMTARQIPNRAPAPAIEVPEQRLDECQPYVDLDRLRADLGALGFVEPEWAAWTEQWLLDMRARGFSDGDILAASGQGFLTALNRVIEARDATIMRMAIAGQLRWVGAMEGTQP